MGALTGVPSAEAKEHTVHTKLAHLPNSVQYYRGLSPPCDCPGPFPPKTNPVPFSLNPYLRTTADISQRCATVVVRTTSRNYPRKLATRFLG